MFWDMIGRFVLMRYCFGNVYKIELYLFDELTCLITNLLSYEAYYVLLSMFYR